MFNERIYSVSTSDLCKSMHRTVYVHTPHTDTTFKEEKCSMENSQLRGRDIELTKSVVTGLESPHSGINTSLEDIHLLRRIYTAALGSL